MMQKNFPNLKNLSSENMNDDKDKFLLFQIPYEGFSFGKTYDFFLNNEISSLIKDFGIQQSSLD